MLSRVAERVYWLARYVERVENTARLARVHSQLMFDLPKCVKLTWYNLIEITSNEDYFYEFYEAKTEKNCMKVLLSDLDNPASLISSLWWARENMRTTRDILPREAWIQINELYLLVKQNLDDFEVRSKRNALLDRVIQQCQAWSGMLYGTMSYNETFRFIRIGMSIERADMTTRLLDVGGLFVMQETASQEKHPFDNILWANLLKSASGYFMYRQDVQTEVTGSGVVEFLFNDQKFVRSLAFSLNMLGHDMSKIPHTVKLLSKVEKLKYDISVNGSFQLGSGELHDKLDQIQLGLSDLHAEFYQVWFNPQGFEKPVMQVA